MLFAILALAPTAMFAADHIVFIHGYQLTGGRADTWDRMVDFMTNSVYGTPFVSSDKVLVVQHGGLSDPIDEVAKDVWEQIKQGFPDGTCPSKMDFVVHSMGGLVLRSMVDQNLLSDSRIGRVVTLATPHYGQRRRGSAQQRSMEYGAEFIWKLANSSKKIAPHKVLCVVGTTDGVVDEWSAALQDNECASIRYVEKDHTALLGYDTDDKYYRSDAICYLRYGRGDVVYQLVTDFLSGGTVVAGGGTGSKNAGAILFKIVDAKGNPVAYYPYLTSIHGGIASAVKTTAGASTPYSDNSPNTILGIGSVVYRHSEISAGSVASSPPKGVEPGQYVLDIPQSRDKVFSAFTSDPIPVVRGRTTVQTIYAESVRPLDYVFLIDTTGSMGSHINSVKANAKNLIESQLLNGARNSRVAVVDYRDFPERTGSSRDYAYDVKCKFTSDAATAIAAINSLILGYGGDGPETVYSGIHACIVEKGAKIGGWQENSVKTIMVMGDAEPLDPEPITGYTKSDVVRWANELKTDEDDEAIDIEYSLKAANMKAAKAASVKAADVVAGASAGGISIYPVVTSSSLVSSFSEIAEETGGKVVSSSSYASVADAVKEVIEQSVAANGFEFEVVSVVETAGSVNVRVFGGSESDSASIGYQVISGSGVNGTDFMAAEGVQRLTWADGERSYKTITIPVIADASTSNDKFFSIVLCDPSGMGLGGINVCRINLLDKDNTSGEYRMGDVYVQGVARNTEMGSVSGSGFCALGSTRTLTATPKSGFVFTSWENGSTASRRSITGAEATSNAVDGVATCVASFIPLADLPLPTIEPSGVVTGVVKEAFYWNLDYHSISEATVTCEGLPPGLVFADGVVSGTPSRSGSWLVTFTVKNVKGDTSMPVMFEFVCNPQKSLGGVKLYSTVDGLPSAKSASVYDGYLYLDNVVMGTIQAKVSKPKLNKKLGVATAKTSVAIQATGEKKITLKGELDLNIGEFTVTDKKSDRELNLKLGIDGITGTFGKYEIDGARNFFDSKDKSEKSAAEEILKPYLGAYSMISDGGILSVNIAKKGKVTIKGSIDGAKVSAKAQVLIGEDVLCIPVIYSKKSVNLAFTIWLPINGGDAVIIGLDDAIIGKAGTLKNGAKFIIDGDIGASIETEDERTLELLPDNETITVSKSKWLVADGIKPAKVAYKKGEFIITEGKKGAGIVNPSGLKLSYKAKDGSFTGSFTAYAIVKGKLKKHKATVEGILIGDVGYGTITINKVGTWAVTIE